MQLLQLNSNKLAKVILIGLLQTPFYSFGMAVIDFANLGQNTASAISAVQQEINQIAQIDHMIKSNLNTLGSLNPFDIDLTSSDLAKLLSSANALKSALGNSATVATETQAMYGAGNYKNANDFATALAKRKAANEASAVNLLKTAEMAQQKVIDSNTKHQTVANSLTTVNGATEAAQATTSAVNVVIEQNQSLLSMVAASNSEQAKQVQEKSIKEQNTADAIKNYKNNNQTRLDELKTKWQ